MSAENRGLVYIFTGNGKGKTSAGLGVALRALAAGLKVAIVQWYKNPSWHISEHEIGTLLTPAARTRFAIYPMGKGFHISTKSVKPSHDPAPQPIVTAPLTTGQLVIDQATHAEHRQAAQQAYEQARKLLSEVDVLILDEVNNAVDDGLLSLDDLLNLIAQHGHTHLILTGRNAPKEVTARADLVTEMIKIKHPYDHGQLALKGLDY